jgi:hypothetical protein
VGLFIEVLMATIVVETGSGSATANSYVSEAELTAYAADRGITVTGTKSELLIRAMDYIESKDFLGTKGTRTQALVFPRFGIFLNNYELSSSAIPQLLKDAQMETAIAVGDGVDPLDNQARQTVKEKVGSLEVEYAQQARAVTFLKAVDIKLAKLIHRSSRVYRV